jgi:hypothetical protein
MTIKEAEEKLMDAIQRVAEAGREVSDEAWRLRDTDQFGPGYHVRVDLMADLRAALKDWTNAGDTLMRTVREENAA